VWMGIPSPWWMNSPMHIWVCPKPSHRPKFWGSNIGPDKPWDDQIELFRADPSDRHSWSPTIGLTQKNHVGKTACHFDHPPVISIFIGAMFTIPSHVFFLMAASFTHKKKPHYCNLSRAPTFMVTTLGWSKWQAILPTRHHGLH
jgi:hypothetical protein